jgi:hypothetical protein
MHVDQRHVDARRGLDNNPPLIKEPVVGELFLDKDQGFVVVDDPVLPAEEWFVPADRKRPARFVTREINAGIEDLPPRFNPVVPDNLSDRNIRFHQVFPE